MSLFKKSKEKIFCIGLNKTGTTTIEKFLFDNTYKLGNQEEAEHLVEDWFKRDFKSLITYCKKYEAFQDAPFSLPYTFIILEQYFPNAKFILTVRDSPDQWYNSLTKFHSKLWSNGIDAPTIEDLKNAEYLYKGYAYDVNRALFNTPENDPYNKKILIEYYKDHNSIVKEYFRSQPNKLLVINVSNKNDYFKLCDFLGKPAVNDNFAWENKTIQ
ncbi:sulfotransferase [Ulvibacter antarcticus]|uniref:Sulfotransferase family protein n=1 Tax=Ulvibacter antarcticus TaxID=442714 RepID=A0A3L9YC64_9FLAO|nr:sulfotransferase [Ulvibacter antarcticus]RMA57964.1 hypothetical protein BXY75_2772 [Ulvibacter antarcticus]